MPQNHLENFIFGSVLVEALAHGSVFQVNVPIKYNSNELHNIVIQIRQDFTQYSFYFDLATLRISDLVSCIKFMVESDPFTKSNTDLTWPQSIQSYKIYNITKKTLTYKQQISHQSQLTTHFEPKMTVLSKLKFYLQWPVDIINLSFMDCCFMKYQVRNRNLPLSYMINQFAEKLEVELLFKRKIKLIIKCISNRKEIDQGCKFSQYRRNFPSNPDEHKCQLSLQLVNEVDPPLQEIKQLFKDLSISTSNYLCPISYELMVNPCYLRSCMHYFDENSIRVSVNKYKYCPFCKAKAELQDIRSDPLLRKAIHHIIEQVSFKQKIKDIMERYQQYPSYVEENCK